MTPQETIEAGRLMIAYGESVLAGKPLDIEAKHETGDWHIVIKPSWNCHDYSFRRAPEPKRVPLDSNDVPLGALVKIPDDKLIWVVSGIDGETIYLGMFGCSRSLDTRTMMDLNCTIDLRDGRGFRPAWKEEV